MPGPKRILGIFGWNVLILLALLALVDVGARFFIRRRTYTLFSDPKLFMSDRPFIAEHQSGGFALQPDFSSPTVRINSGGFRGAEFPAAFRGMYRIVVLGESTTFGWKPGDGDTYPHQLQRC